MASKDFDVFRSDVLVIGGGGAGLLAAIKAREKGADVILVSKSRVGYGNNTYISKSGLSAALGRPDLKDDPDTHLRDSVLSGCFVNDQKILHRVVQEALPQIPFLEKCGVEFQRSGQDRLLALTPGHSRPRSLHSPGQKGSEYSIPLRRHALKIGVRLVENVIVTRLFAPHRRFAGAAGLSLKGDTIRFEARSCILATGGFAQVYLRTNNAAGTTGDGQALAYEAGVPLRDMEFVQFYPTSQGDLGRPMLLYENFLFQGGAVFRNSAGEDIAAKHGLVDPKSLTRDRLARALFLEILNGLDVSGGVVMDIGKAPRERILKLRHLLPVGWTPEQTRFIVAPTTHFCMGGAVTNERGETDVSGLYAAGEVCGGVHGANRIAGNALAEVFVMGGIVGAEAADFAKKVKTSEPFPREAADEMARLPSTEGKAPCKTDPLRDLRHSLKESMWKKAGIVRNGADLVESLEEIKGIRDALSELRTENGRDRIRAFELKNMLLVSEMVSRAALMRTESRGAHYRSDYPDRDDTNWLSNIVIRKGTNGMELERAPVSFPLLAP